LTLTVKNNKKKYSSFITYRLLLFPHLHSRFVFLELVTPVRVNFLIVIAFVRCCASGVAKRMKEK
jgi:hypothetical protein